MISKHPKPFAIATILGIVLNAEGLIISDVKRILSDSVTKELTRRRTARCLACLNSANGIYEPNFLNNVPLLRKLLWEGLIVLMDGKERDAEIFYKAQAVFYELLPQDRKNEYRNNLQHRIEND